MDLSRVFVRGIGVVSPAGWDVSALRAALDRGVAMPDKDLVQPGFPRTLRVRSVPPPPTRPQFLSHARLRRSSPITQFSISAALEALGPEIEPIRSGALRLGIIFCVMAGCVNYSRRFYGESLHDPATASPLVFPETVFNAPASHLAAFLGSTAASYTLVGDPGMFLVGLATAADWLREREVERCLVVGAEEIDWMVADVCWRFQRRTILSEGAGALYLSSQADQPAGCELAAITDAHSFLQNRGRLQAAAAMRAQVPLQPDDLLCDSTQGIPGLDAAERRAWSDWTGARLSPKTVLGEGLAASSAWQCVAALDALNRGPHSSATVSVVGCNQQAVAARFLTAAVP